MQIIPTKAVPNQTLTCILSAQACSIKIYQRSTGVYVDLYVNNALVIGGVLALNNVKIVRNLYLGFIGDIAFSDTQPVTAADGTVVYADPDFTGLGTRFVLVYLDATEAKDT